MLLLSNVVIVGIDGSISFSKGEFHIHFRKRSLMHEFPLFSRVAGNLLATLILLEHDKEF